MENSAKLGLKMTARLAYSKSRISSKIITVLLSAFAFTLFAFGSLGYTYNYNDYLHRGYRNYVEKCIEHGNDFICFEAYFMRPLTMEQVSLVKEELGIPFVNTATPDTSWCYYVADGTNLIKENIPAEEGETAPKKKDYDFFKLRYRGPRDQDSRVGEFAVEGTEEDFEAMEYTLLAGRYPRTPQEVVISEAHFSAFWGRGYRDVSSRFLNGWNGSDSYADDLPQYEIEKYSDMLGKRLGQGTKEDDFYTVVGVAETRLNVELAKERQWVYPAGCFLRGIDPLRQEASFMFTRQFDMETVDRCVDFSLEQKEKAELADKVDPLPLDEDGVQPKRTYPILYYLDGLFPQGASLIQSDSFQLRFDSEADIMAFLFGGLGIFFGIFAFVLNAYFVSKTVQDKQKTVGILRSMGADRRTILKVFLTEVLFTAMAIFLVALVLSLTLYYSVIMPWTTIESFGISFAVYNGWTVLILAAVCYFVPFLSAIVPLMLFFKKPIVANISGETKRFRRGRVKVQPMS